MNHHLSRWPALALATLVLASVAFAAEESPPKILFVHLRLKDGAFTIVNATNVPGVLKSRRGPAPHQDFQLVLEDAGGKELCAEHIADPSVQRLEYEDPARPGEIQVKEVRLPEAEMTVRLPARTGQRRLAIYRRAEVTAAGAANTNAPARELVSRLTLPAGVTP